MLRTVAPLAALLLATGLLSVEPASAATQCMPIAQFNTYMAQNGLHTATATLTFDVTNVDPDHYFGTKGALAQFDDSACTTGVTGFITKLYGPDDPPNLNHPPGTLKQEFNDECCPNPPCGEDWASPNPSATIFSDGSELCTVEVWLNPTDHGYHIDCDGNLHDASGPNVYNVQIDQASILVGVNGTTWPMPNAVSTWNEICFETVGPSHETMDLPAMEDVTASSYHPTSVYPYVDDLSCGAGDSEFFMKFDVTGIPGLIEGARLHLHSLDDGSANGDGGDLYLVTDNGWSENTLTWNTRPAVSGNALDRVSPVDQDQAYALDASAAVTGLQWYSLALIPQPGDTNGVHFHSQESSPTLGPILRVTYTVEDADGDGFPAGPDCDDGNPAVNPDAQEDCTDAIDNDCDGDTDEDDSDCTCPDDDTGDDDVSDDDGADDDSEGDDDDTEGGGGEDAQFACECRADRPAVRWGGPMLTILALGAAILLRRRFQTRPR